jgi:hypothetical protein
MGTCLTHANESVHAAAHILSFPLGYSLPPLQIGHADQSCRPQLAPAHYSRGRYTRRLVCCIDPSWQHALSPHLTIASRLLHRLSRMLDATTIAHL